MTNILLIEPDAILSQTYSLALQQAGYTIHTVVDAQQAIQMADTHKPDLVILELQLAAHNGVEFLYEFRSYIEWQTIPIIVQSVVPRTMVQLPVLQQELGIVDYLYKPRTSLQQLVASVQKQLAVPAV